MNALKKLKANNREKPYFGWPKLSHGYHEIFAFSEENGRYGRGISVELKNEKLFRPQYMVEKLDEEDIRELKDTENRLYLYFGGKHAAKK